MPLNPQGFRAKRAAEWRQQIQDRYENATGLDVDWERDTFLANIVAIMAEKLGELSQGARSAYETFDLSEAQGKYLDVLASLYGVSRLRATFSTVDVVLEGTANTTIPSGSEVQDVDGTTWVLRNNVDLGANGQATAEFRVANRGSIQIEPLDIDTRNQKGAIVSSVAGWDAAYNPNTGTVGRDEETDAELRARTQRSQQRLGAGTLQSLQASVVEDVEDVEAVFAVENDADVVSIINGDTFKPHSFTLYIYPQTPSTVSQSAYESQIASSILANSPAGIRSGLEIPQVTESVALNDGHSKDISWEWVNDYPVDTFIDVQTKPRQTIGQATVEEEVRDYFDQLNPGEDVRQLPVLGQLSKYDAVDEVTSLQYQPPVGGASDSLIISVQQIATDANVTVNIS
jgi:hypothetical protein